MKSILIFLFIIFQGMAILLKLLWGDDVNWGWQYFFLPSYLFAIGGIVYWIWHVVKLNKNILK
jgi:hypothetical protein